MELRIQTYSFFMAFACWFLLAGCGSYQIEEEAETSEAVGPYEMDVTLSNPQLFTSLYPCAFICLTGTERWFGKKKCSLRRSGQYSLSLQEIMCWWLFPAFRLRIIFLQWR